MSNFEYFANYNDNVLDIRDVIERFEELEGEERDIDSQFEFEKILQLLENLAGQGGDEKWQGDRYPVTLINQDYFTKYAIDMLKDCGDLPKDIPWYIEIDEEKTAKNLLVDYSEIEINGATFYYR